jgi:predicted phage tail protein
MKTVVLHGELAEKFGAEWKLNVSSAAEAVRAIEANHPGFAQHIIDSDKQGVGYRVIVGEAPITVEEIPAPFSNRETLQIVPVIGGSKSGIFGIIAGIALIVASFIPGLNVAVWAGMSTTWASLAFSIGTSLLLGGVSQMLAGNPDTPKQDQAQAFEDKPSYYFNGAAESTNQGAPVAVGYGELIVGSHPISRGFEAENLI